MKSFASTSTGGSFEGEFIIQQGCRHMRYSPNQKGESVLRVVPCINNGIPEPMITNPDIIGGEGLSNCFIEVDIAAYLGTKKYNMIAPPPVPGETKGMIHHFYDFIKKYEETKPVTCPRSGDAGSARSMRGPEYPSPHSHSSGHLRPWSRAICSSMVAKSARNKEGKGAEQVPGGPVPPSIRPEGYAHQAVHPGGFQCAVGSPGTTSLATALISRPAAL